FAVLYKDLGGPAWFHVEGIALGFGFNRALIVPDVDGVKTFPFVQAAKDQRYLSSTDPNAVVTAVQQCIPPARGAYWLAAGVKFSSFEMIQSVALVTISFGAHFEIDLLGYSEISIPTGASSPIAYAELEIKASFIPDQGVLMVRGQLT